MSDLQSGNEGKSTQSFDEGTGRTSKRTGIEKEERIILVGYILGMIAREANQRGDIKVNQENIEKLLGVFHAEPVLTDEEQELIQFIETLSFQLNFELGTNRDSRREKLNENKKVYKLQ